jgi:exopolyphosphatase/guanosine-5'-triphosphate,3'-diphosphate pyrophosphatase
MQVLQALAELPTESPAASSLVAVLEIGSTGIRLLVAQIAGKGVWKEVDRAEKPVALGRDVFMSGTVSRSSLLECLSVLRNFRELLSGWGIPQSAVHLIATSALREARNREVFADRVFQETGYRLTIVEGVEENRLMYLAVRFALKQTEQKPGAEPPVKDLPLFWRGNTMIIDIGGGSTEIMLLRRGKMVAAHSLRLGTILIDQQSRMARRADWFRDRYLTENIRNTIAFLKDEMELASVKTFVVTGSDTRVAAALIGTELNTQCRVMERDDFLSFVEKIRHYTIEECVQKLRINYGNAEGFVSGILIYKCFLEQTQAQQVMVPVVSIREGLLIDLTRGVDVQEEFSFQIIASAINLGRKYHFDEAHSLHVAALCMTIFDAFVKEHGLNRRERMLLETAALLHDIGMFVRGSSHHKHSQYLVVNSEIFGLHREELDIIANVVRYHRGEPPSPSDISYIALQREERVLVLKMASILRVADALDRGHSQQIKRITFERRHESVILHAEGNSDRSLERIGLEKKADMFQDVFGYKVILV